MLENDKDPQKWQSSHIWGVALDSELNFSAAGGEQEAGAAATRRGGCRRTASSGQRKRFLHGGSSSVQTCSVTESCPASEHPSADVCSHSSWQIKASVKPAHRWTAASATWTKPPQRSRTLRGLNSLRFKRFNFFSAKLKTGEKGNGPQRNSVLNHEDDASTDPVWSPLGIFLQNKTPSQPHYPWSLPEFQVLLQRITGRWGTRRQELSIFWFFASFLCGTGFEPSWPKETFESHHKSLWAVTSFNMSPAEGGHCSMSHPPISSFGPHHYIQGRMARFKY